MRKSLVLIAAFVLAASGAQQTDLTERSILLRKHAGNVTYDVELMRGTERAIVPPNYKFQSGDRFALRVKVAADSYVYVLNRTFVGSPDELRSNRQIRLVLNPPPDSGQPATGPGSPLTGPDAKPPGPAMPAYNLVYPKSGSRQLKAGKLNVLPGSSMALEMDEHPGVEQLVLIVSPTPLRIASMFDSVTGELKIPGVVRQDTTAEVSTKLDQELAAMAKNAEAEESSVPSRSIVFIKINEAPSVVPPGPTTPPSPESPITPPGAVTQKPHVDTSSVVVPKRVGQPFLVDIVLAHYPR